MVLIYTCDFNATKKLLNKGRPVRVFATPARHSLSRGLTKNHRSGDEGGDDGRNCRPGCCWSGRHVRASCSFCEKSECIKIGIVVVRFTTALHKETGMSHFIKNFRISHEPRISGTAAASRICAQRDGGRSHLIASERHREWVCILCTERP